MNPQYPNQFEAAEGVFILIGLENDRITAVDVTPVNRTRKVRFSPT